MGQQEVLWKQIVYEGAGTKTSGYNDCTTTSTRRMANKKQWNILYHRDVPQYTEHSLYVFLTNILTKNTNYVLTTIYILTATAKISWSR